MKYLDAGSVRELFLKFFESKDHKRVKSYSLIPPKDPTLLFVNAGMVQFKDVFIGKKKLPYKRATSSQKCLRVSGKHNDLENVGYTPRHHTFFEMLGNFSFGDYFKEEAIQFAWEFLTEHLQLDPEKLYVTVHPEDDEAFRLWRDKIGVPVHKIIKDSSNFWAMGDTGPCGPCSEIHYDLGEELGKGDVLKEGYEGNRFLEIWNLVFMQYETLPDGTRRDLPAPSIDTGMGLERIVSVVQGKLSNYETDLFMPIIATIENISGRKYGENEEVDVAIRVIADHARASAFLVADNIFPENEGRGYVLRRIMRRGIRYGQKLGIKGEFLSKVCLKVVEIMGDAYPELVEKKDTIEKVVGIEEEKFLKTLESGLQILNNAMEKVKKEGKSTIPGDVVFKLYDTHGFPPDLTALIARENGLDIDTKGFEEGMEAQRQKGRASWKKGDEELSEILNHIDSSVTVTFTGYEEDETETKVVYIITPEGHKKSASKGERCFVITEKTPFYGEAGGQVGDTGYMFGDSFKLKVKDTKKPLPEVIIHDCVVEEGEVKIGDKVICKIDSKRRNSIRRNHTGTHLLQYALRKVLGEHVGQRGSLVEPDRLRFDFSHFNPVTEEELLEVQRLVNLAIMENFEVKTEIMPMEEAIKGGAIAFFEEKYGEVVRVVSIDGISKELCGGTHCRRTGDIGMFVITSETGVSAGVRRITALTGEKAILYYTKLIENFNKIRGLFPGAEDKVIIEKIESMFKEIKDLKKEIKRLKTEQITLDKDAILKNLQKAGDVSFLAQVTKNVTMDQLRNVSDRLRSEIKKGVVFLINKTDKGTLNLLIAKTKNIDKTVHCGKIMKEIAPILGGKGGGREDIAQGGGSDPSKIELAMNTFYDIMKKILGEGSLK